NRPASHSFAGICHIPSCRFVIPDDERHSTDVTTIWRNVIMQARMSNVAMIMPEAMQALLALGKSAEKGSVPSRTIGLVQLRASQINGCSVCVDMHPRYMKQAGETDERLFTVAAWRDAPYF